MTNLSIKSKLLAMLLGVSAVSIAVVSTLNYSASYEALRASVFMHLTSVRASKADALEQYIERIRSELRVLAASPSLGMMSNAFAGAVRELEDTTLKPEQLAELEAYYREEFMPKLDAMVSGTPEFETLFPASNASRYLQYHYIANNPFPAGNELQLNDPGDGSTYSEVHDQWHRVLRRILNGFGYYDLFLIDIQSGRIVYTTAKEIDFATSLISGPHAQSNLARLFRTVQRNPDRGAARIIDFEHYRPSRAAPAMFVAVPVFEKGRPVAVLAAQESTGELDRVITGGRQWERDGLGKTGESVLIGPDYLLRSASRFLIEDPEGYAADQRSIATSDDVIERILRLNSPILEQEVRTVAAEQALSGRTNTGVIIDYRGREILGSWAPLKLVDLDWAIVGKMDLSEAYAPIYRLARDTLIQSVVILVVVTLVVMVLANSFVRPINDLIARVRRFGAGDEEVEFDRDFHDEIGDLAKSFRDLVESARQQTRLIERVSNENERLLGNLLPRRIAQQVKHGDEDLVETVPDVSVLFAETRGLVEVTYERSANESIEILKRIISAADSLGEKHGVERIKTMGDTYMGAVGLSAPVLDHMRRAVEFAGELRDAVERIGNEYEMPLSLRLGISAGPVVTDVVHDEELLFHLWGEAVIQADHARDRASNGQIVVTQVLYDKLADSYRFARLPAEEPIPLWSLEKG
ncbi:MAG: HAMP domain-containing protein [Gammaproteobacteria bacterium]|nr:HAMP domain-containing protein [Gammaproteobacteria bacterium]